MSHSLLIYEIGVDEEDPLGNSQLLWKFNLYFYTHCLRKYEEKDSEETISSQEKIFCPFFDEVDSCYFAIYPREDKVNFAVFSKNGDESLIITQIGVH